MFPCSCICVQSEHYPEYAVEKTSYFDNLLELCLMRRSAASSEKLLRELPQSSALLSDRAQTQGHRHKGRDTRAQTQGHRHKGRDTRAETQGQRHKGTDTRAQTQGHRRGTHTRPHADGRSSVAVWRVE